jgi:hypothetical protein
LLAVKAEVGVGFIVKSPVVALHPVVVDVKVKVTNPGNRAVTSPALVTEAIVGLLLTQVPPEAGDNVVVKP